MLLQLLLFAVIILNGLILLAYFHYGEKLIRLFYNWLGSRGTKGGLNFHHKLWKRIVWKIVFCCFWGSVVFYVWKLAHIIILIVR